MSIDSLRPEVYATGDGRIAIFVGGGYRYLPIEVAEKFAAAIVAEIAKAKAT